MAGLLASFLFSACTPSEPRADIVIVNGLEPESLDPAIITGQADARVALGLFEGLTRFDPVTAKGIPGIAESWDISPDGLTYTFHLRSNAVWSTGEPITAQDFVYSWLRVLDPLTASDYAGQLFFLKNAEDFQTGKIKDPSLVGVHALDDRTLRVDLHSPTAFFIDLCAFQTLSVVPRKAIEAHGDRWIMTPPVPVSGAYLLESWRIHDKIRLRKNPRYWDAANTRNNVVDLLPVDSDAIAMNLYETGQADIVWDKTVIPMHLMDMLTNRPYCHIFDYLGTYFLRINTTRKPLDDVRVRKALALCIDKESLTKKLNKAGEKAASHFTPKGLANYEPPEGLGYDPNQARRLLADAGYPGGKGFPTFQYLFNSSKQNEQFAVEIQAMLRRELGIRIELRQVEWKVYLVALSSLDFDIARSSWIGDYADSNTFLDMWMSNNGNNRTGWKNQRYDQLVRDGNMQLDPKQRAQLLREAETLLVRDELPIIPLYFYVGINFYDPKKIDGIYLNILDEHPISAIARINGRARLSSAHR
jgi:oligopeptide transport system substrate-binding protein